MWEEERCTKNHSHMGWVKSVVKLEEVTECTWNSIIQQLQKAELSHFTIDWKIPMNSFCLLYSFSHRNGSRCIWVKVNCYLREKNHDQHHRNIEAMISHYSRCNRQSLQWFLAWKNLDERTFSTAKMILREDADKPTTAEWSWWILCGG